jgi:protein SCO1/2
MLNQLSHLQSNEKFLRIIRVVLLMVLLTVSYVVGSNLNRLFQTNSGSAITNITNPNGAALVEPPHLLQDFTLTSHRGDSIRLSDLRGQVVLLFFGYTHCPDVCPTTLADYRRIKQSLGDHADEVAFVFISVDGGRDTSDVLADYLGQFDTDFIGMTGDGTKLRQIGAEYGLLFQQETISVGHEHEAGYTHPHGDELDAENYFVQHTSPSFLIDRNGYLRLIYFYRTEPDVIAEGIRQVLQ